MRMWEYELRFIIPGDESPEILAEMNAMGQDGWEIVGFFAAGSGAMAITYKRPIEQLVVRLLTKEESDAEPPCDL